MNLDQLSNKSKNKYQPLATTQQSLTHIESDGNWLVSYADMMTLLVGFFVILLSFSSVDREKFDKMKKAVTEEFGGLYQEPFGELADQIKGTLDKMGLGKSFIVKKTPDGVVVSLQGAVFFNSGSAELKDEAKVLLNKLVPVIKSKAKDFKITVEGHTDDTPISGGALRNNWELSSMRACRVLGEFLAQGISEKDIVPVGYSDTKAVARNRDDEGIPIPENQAQNRRVVIRLQKPAEALLKENKNAVTKVN